jgi:hypothetical protein
VRIRPGSLEWWSKDQAVLLISILINSQKVAGNLFSSFPGRPAGKPESSFLKQLYFTWTPAGVYPAAGGAGVTTFYEFVNFDFMITNQAGESQEKGIG